MTKLIPPVLVLLLLAAYGLAEGLWTDRWQASPATDQAAARLATLPQTIGDWAGTDEALDARQIAVAELSGYLMRRYVHRTTGDAVTVLLVCGRPGPIAVHTPDVCFRGVGYSLPEQPKRRQFEGNSQAPAPEFWVGRFEKPEALLPESLTVLWAWSADGRWSAPDNPRVAFARERALYKLYLVRRTAQPNERPANDAALTDFVKLFLPAARAALFPAS